MQCQQKMCLRTEGTADRGQGWNGDGLSWPSYPQRVAAGQRRGARHNEQVRAPSSSRQASLADAAPEAPGLRHAGPTRW